MLRRPRARRATALVLTAAMAAAPLGCESLPGDEKTQGAVIGGAAGAATGAVVADDHRAVGAIIGGLLGAGGGYLIGTQVEKTRDKDGEKEAEAAATQARTNPATSADVRRAATADLNSDGFVTTDELVAMSEAGLNDQEMIARLEATGQVFELTDQQEQQLIDAGVSATVVRQLETINQDARRRVAQQGNQDVISRPAE